MIDLVHKAHRSRYLELWGRNEVRATRDRLGVAIQRAAELNGRAQFTLASDVNGMHAFAPSPEGVTIQRMAALDAAADYCLTASNEQAKRIVFGDITYLVQTEREGELATTLGWRFFTKRIHFEWITVDPASRLEQLAKQHDCGLVTITELEEDSRMGVCFHDLSRRSMPSMTRLSLASAISKMESE